MIDRITMLTLATIGALVVACSTNSTIPTIPSKDGGDLGCCPDVQSNCTLHRYGRKTTANDDCIGGYDGIVPDPSQPGWMHGKDANGCPYWSPPAGMRMIQCGARPIEAGDAMTDGPTHDASAVVDSSADVAPEGFDPGVLSGAFIVKS